MEIIKSKYNADNIEFLYHGTKEMESKRMHIDIIVTSVGGLSLLIYGILLSIIVSNGSLNTYWTVINDVFKKIPFVCDFSLAELIYQYNAAMISSGKFWLSIIVFLLFFLVKIIFLLFPLGLLLKLTEKELNLLSKQLHKQYRITPRPCSWVEYTNLRDLYEQEEKFLSYLEIDEHPDITLQGDDYVKITIHKQNIMEEHRLRFPGIISKLFQPDKMDFSYLDELVEAALQKKNKEG